MLTGLRAAASALSAISGVMSVTAENTANINTQNYHAKFAHLAEASPGVKISSISENDKYISTFTKDNYAGIYDSYGRMLFKSVSPDIEIDDNGYIVNNGELAGQINIFPQVKSNNIIKNIYTAPSDVNLTKEKVNEILSFRAFQANIKMVHAQDDLLGTILNLKA